MIVLAAGLMGWAPPSVKTGWVSGLAAAPLVLAQAKADDDPSAPSQRTPDLNPKASGEGAPSEPKTEATRAQSLDALFGRLSKTNNPEEATGIAALIQRLWMQSGSDTADLLMNRAMVAMSNDNHELAQTLLDKILIVRPEWAEAWNKRATLRFLDNDDAGSMEDISHVLVLEPRHFGALSGLGFILKRNGLDKAALKALRRAEEIYPESSDIRKAVQDLVPDVEGRDL